MAAEGRDAGVRRLGLAVAHEVGRTLARFEKRGVDPGTRDTATVCRLA